MSNAQIPDPLTQLRAQARILHRRAVEGDPDVVAWLERFEPDLQTINLQRRHCLSALAREFGFRGWPHLVQLVSSEGNNDPAENTANATNDFGTLLCPPGSAAYWNVWSAHYSEARNIREEHGGYLLAYRQQYLIVDRHFIEHLGLDPNDSDWEAIGRDWIQPVDRSARTRLYGKLFQVRQSRSSLLGP